MKARYVKSEFELYFPIFNRESSNLFQNDAAYADISQKVNRAKQVLGRINENQVYVVDYYANQFPVLTNIPVKQLREALRYIQSQIRSKGRVKLPRFFGWTYTPKKLRVAKNLAGDILCDRDNAEIELITELLIEQCAVIAELQALEELWEITCMSFESAVSQYTFVKTITNHAEEALRLYEKGMHGVEFWSSTLGLQDSYHCK